MKARWPWSRPLRRARPLQIFSTLSDDPVLRALQLHNLGIKTRNEVLQIIHNQPDP